MRREVAAADENFEFNIEFDEAVSLLTESARATRLEGAEKAYAGRGERSAEPA